MVVDVWAFLELLIAVFAREEQAVRCVAGDDFAAVAAAAVSEGPLVAKLDYNQHAISNEPPGQASLTCILAWSVTICDPQQV